MDATAAEKSDPKPAQDGPAATSGPNKKDKPAAAETPTTGPPASADDRPQQHGITDELAHLFLKRFLPADTQFVMKSYKYRPIASLGEGYTTVRKVLEVTYRDVKSGKEDVALFIVKVPSGNFVNMIREMGVYEREVIMYSQIIEHFRYILSQRGKQVLLPFPRYVYGRMVLSGEVKDDHDQPIPNQMPTEMLVIELLDDFQVVDKKVGLDLDHLRLVMPALARFHAVGLVLRQRHSKRADRLREINIQMPKEFDQLESMRSPMCSILEHLGMQAEADGLANLTSIEHVREAYKNAFSEELDVVTLVHGDLWSANMMFRYEMDADGVKRPVEIRFVDLQMCQFGDLAYDLVYCLLSSSKRETRRGHIREMLTWYEEAFRSQLQELGEDPEQIAPWLSLEKLISMYSHSLSQNVNMPINVIQLLFSLDEDRAEMLGGSGAEDWIKAFKSMGKRWRDGHYSPELKQRLVGIVEDLKEFGHI